MTGTMAKTCAALAAIAMVGCASDGAGGEGRDSATGSQMGAPMGAAGNAAPGGNPAPSLGTDRSGGAPTPGSSDGNASSGGSDSSGGTDRSGGGDTSGGSTGGSDAAAANVDCSALPAPENADDMVAHFEEGTGATVVVPGRGGGFYMFDDGTSTQDPPPGSLPPAQMMNRCDSLYALCMSGSGFSEWGAGMGTDLGPVEGDVKSSYDVSGYSGIAFWAKIATGTSGAVRVALKDANTAPEGGVCDENESSGATACNDDWGKALNVTSEWKPYTITFAELRQAGWGAAYDAFDQSAVYSIQFQFGPNLDFDFCIDDLQLVP